MQDVSVVEAATSFDWNAVVSIGALALSAYSQYLLYRERSQKFREVLFEKQLDAIVWLNSSMATIVDEARKILLEHGRQPLTDGVRQQINDAIRPLLEEQLKQMHPKVIYLPEDIVDKAFSLVQVLSALAATPDRLARYPREITQSSNPQFFLEDRAHDLVDILRRHIGVERLTKQTRDIIEGAN
jgi:hypothetical protein